MRQENSLPHRFVVDATVFEGPFTGVAKATLGLYEGCHEVNPDLQITFLHRAKLQAKIPSFIQTVSSPGFIPKRPSTLWRSVKLPLYVARTRPQVVHFPWNGGIPSNLPKRIFKVMTLHDVLPLTIPHFFSSELRLRYHKKSLQQHIRRADLVITDSEYSRSQILSHFEVHREPIVVYPASPLRASSKKQKTTQNPEVFFLYCGGYDKRKGIEELAESFVNLWQDPTFRTPLVIAGATHYYSEKLEKLITTGKQLGAIRELGYIPDEELAQLYSTALSLIYPSRYEGFGLPPLEAMTMGCPVITYASTSIPEVCGEAALYLDADDEYSIQKCVREMANNKELRERLSAQGMKQSQKFSWRKAGEIFLGALNEQYQKRAAGIG